MPCQTPGTVSFSEKVDVHTAIPMFRTFDSRAASTGSRLSMIASCERVSGFDAAASSLINNNQLTKLITVLKNKRRHSHCSCRSRSMSPLLPLRVADSLVSRASNNGAPESGRRGSASSSEELLRLESSRRSGQARNGTVLQPCKSWRSHGCLSSAHTQ